LEITKTPEPTEPWYNFKFYSYTIKKIIKQPIKHTQKSLKFGIKKIRNVYCLLDYPFFCFDVLITIDKVFIFFIEQEVLLILNIIEGKGVEYSSYRIVYAEYSVFPIKTLNKEAII
jgi:hypothetical protein